MKHSRFIKLFSMIMILVLLFTGLPVFALDMIQETPLEIEPIQEVVMPDFVSAMAVREGRTYTARVHEMEQSLNEVVLRSALGKYSVYLFNEDVKYVDDNGQIRDKDTTLIPTLNGYQQRSNNIQSIFPNQIATGIGYKVEDYLVRFFPLTTVSGNSLLDISNDGYGENTATYSGVFGENTALRYTVYNNMLKEDVILNSYTGQNAFSFQYLTGGLYFEAGESIRLMDPATDNTIFTIPTPIAYDSAGNQVICDWEIVPLKQNTSYTFTITVPQSFLTDSSTVYPVYVDPSLTVRQSGTANNVVDTRIVSGQTAAVSSTETSLPVGTTNTNQTAIALFDFPSLASKNSGYYRDLLLNPNKAKKATFYVYNLAPEQGYNDYSTTLTAHSVTAAWSAATATYATLSANIASTAIATKIIDFYSEIDPYTPWHALDVTEVIKNMMPRTVDGSMTQLAYGIALKTSDSANYAQFASSEHSNASRRPYLMLEYLEEDLPTSQNSLIQSGSYYRLKNMKNYYEPSVYYLDMYDDVAKIQELYTLNETDNNYDEEEARAQEFRVVYAGQGKYTLYNWVWGCFVGAGTSNINGQSVPVMKALFDNSDPSCFWYFITPQDATSVIYLVNASNPLLLANTNAEPLEPAEGTKVRLSSNDGYSAQWIMEATNRAPYAMYSQNNPALGTGWNTTNLDKVRYSSSTNESLLQEIQDAGCAITSVAMILNNGFFKTTNSRTDFRTGNQGRLEADPFTVTMANTRLSATEWRNIVSDNSNYRFDPLWNSDSSPVLTNWTKVGSEFGTSITREALSGTSAQKAERIHQLLSTRPEGIIVYGAGHASAIFYSYFDNTATYANDTQIASCFVGYDPYNLSITNDYDGDGMSLQSFSNTYHFRYSTKCNSTFSNIDRVYYLS